MARRRADRRAVEPAGVIRVINDGPAIPAQVLAGLKHRFARGESGRRRRARAGHRGDHHEPDRRQLELLSPAPGRSRGFEARLMLRLSNQA